MKPLWITACDEHFRPMLEEHFLPSFREQGLEQDFELQLGAVPSVYGDFGSDQYNESYLKGLEAVHLTVRSHPGRLIVWSDTDLRFYGNLTGEISDLAKWYHLCTAQDSLEVACTGFMFFRASPVIDQFFSDWITLTRSHRWAHAQESYNALLLTAHLNLLRLPPKYWTSGLSGKREVWESGRLEDIPNPPTHLLLHHGNFTRGLENKLKLMHEIKRRVAART